MFKPSDNHVGMHSALEIARRTLQVEAEAIQQVAERLDGQFLRAIEIILAHNGKVVVTGIGKSGHIGQKLAATLSSTGTPAVFMHAAEAVHGDLGVYCPGDPTILLSRSGATAELVRLLPVLRQFRSPLIAILGNLRSPLARQADVVLDGFVANEADFLDLAPTSSSIAALALGDALAIALMRARDFRAEDFARLHPAGQLGRNLWMRVAEVMHPVGQIAVVSPVETVKQAVITMTRHRLGAVCVVDPTGILCGIVTDGDLRRALQTDDDIRQLPVRQVMTASPITINSEATLKEAVDLMEKRASQISVLPVVDGDGYCLGLVRIHDIYQADLQ